MWKVYRYAEADVYDLDGFVIYEKGTWYPIGEYDNIDVAAAIVKHEIYLDNCVCQDGDPVPKLKIESALE